MKRFIKDLAVLIFLFSLMGLHLTGDIDRDSSWQLKLEIKVNGSFNSIKKADIRGLYKYNAILNGIIGLDEDKDFIYYQKEGEVKNFELKYFNPETNKNTIFKDKNVILNAIEFIIRNGRYVYLEFVTENLDISKLDKDIDIRLSSPVSYGILKRKSKLNYRKGIKEGSNKIFWKEKLLYSKLNFKKNYNWTWTNTSKNIQESHSVEIQLYIKIIKQI